MYLHGDGEVVLGLRWEEHIHSFLWEGLVARRWGAHLDDVQLGGASMCCSHNQHTHPLDSLPD